MRSWMIAFCLGVFWAGYIPEISPTQQVPLYLLFLIIPLLSLRFAALRLSGAFFLGLFWFLHWAHIGLARLLPIELENRDIWVIGRVVSLPQQTAGYAPGSMGSQRFELQIEQICQVSLFEQCQFHENPHKNQKVLLNVYQNSYQSMADTSAALVIKPEQQWRFKVKLKRPHGFANPGGFDYEAWLFQGEISATGYVRHDSNNKLLAENTQTLSFAMLRYMFRERLKHLFTMKNSDYVKNNENLIKALTIGDRYNITYTEWNLFTATGTNHLMVISGLHVGLITLLIYHLSSFIVSCLPALSKNFPSRRFGAAFAVLTAFFYAGLAGFSLPAQRALIMVVVFMSGQMLCRNTNVTNSFCLAMAIILLFEPLAPQGSGFWLSFGAVGLLILLADQHANATAAKPFTQKALQLVKTQTLLSLGLLPLMLLFFQQTSLLAPVVNLIAIPFVSLLVVPLCLAGLLTIWYLPGLAQLLLSCAGLLLMLFKQGLGLITSLAINPTILLPALDWTGLLSVIIGIAILIILPLRSKLQVIIKLLSLLCFLPLFYSRQSPLSKGEFTLNILDVGQGLAIVISTSNHHLLYDTGPVFSPRFEAGNGVVIPFLRAQNIPEIDRIIVSHADNDHAGGLPAIAEFYPQALYAGGDSSIFAAGLRSQNCEQGESWVWDEVKFEILHPDNTVTGRYSRNNVSCVLKVSAGHYSVLLAGDIEKSVERLLLASHKDKLKADVLIAPHHGSLTSSSKPFIAAVAPEYVVFSTGYLNRFRHPHPEIVSRYGAAQVKTLNTANSGAVLFHISASSGVEPPLKWREVRKRYWSSL